MRYSMLGFITSLCVVSFAMGQQEDKAHISDQQITDAVEREFWTDQAVDANTIDVEARNGIVTLEGSTKSLLPRDRAVSIAESIRGVRGVVNLIKVQPKQVADAELADSVEQALLNDPATDSYEVVTTVKNGEVKLRGIVDSWQEKQLCTIVAKGVPGVRAVNNRLTIDYKQERPDLEIRPEIAARLANDVRVDDYLIHVDVHDGKVTLSGTVGSLAEKRRAMTDAWVVGVKSVDGRGLQVRSWARDKLRRQSSYMNRSDKKLREAIDLAFVYDPRIASYKVDVSVNAGTVTLSGVVLDLDAKQSAEQTARNVLGVWRVKNRIKVRPEKIPADEVLEQRVAKALRADPFVERFDVNVDATNGWVFLTGTVNSSFEKTQAENAAIRVKGVTGVTNAIENDYTWTWKPDREIEDDINDELFWSPFVDDDLVHVQVEDGIATLRGTVETWSERVAAEENAWEGGAKDVRNRLDVAYDFYGPQFPYWDPYHGVASLDDITSGAKGATAKAEGKSDK